MSLTNYGFLTFADAVDHTLDQVLGGDASLRNRRQAVRAVREAYAEIPARRNWRYYYRAFSLQTVGNSTTGTISYDCTGGTYERMVTLTNSTWPTDVAGYGLIIDSTRYSVDQYKSSTVLTLDENDCPTADISSGQAFNLVKDSYELPATCRAIFTLYDTNAPGRLIPCVDPGDVIRERRLVRGSALPVMYSAFRSELYSGSMAIHFAPSPSGVRHYQCYGLFWPAPLAILDYSDTGTVATTAGSTTVTGTSTSFSSDHVGCVIRISPSGVVKIPTDIQGEADKNRLEPFAIQGVVKSVESTTSLTLEVAASKTVTGSGFRISSLVDIEPGAMRNAFLRCCEAKFATTDRKLVEQREALYEAALTKAMYADQRVFETVGPTWLPTSLAGYAATIDLTTGGAQP
jgi:hypothetical protein